MTIIGIKKLDPRATVPTYAHHGDAGMDMRACLCDALAWRIWPGETMVIPTGIAMEIPYGFFGSARERSSLAIKGLRLGGGVIDSSYRGEIKGVLTNLSNRAIDINHGDKIFQIIIQPCEHAAPVEVEEFSDSARGENGFGSTGV